MPNTTVGDLIDSIYRDWLTPADDQPTRLLLDANMTNTATMLSYEQSLLSPEEERILSTGTIVEVGLEQMLVKAVDETANDLTVVRGYNGTDAIAHSSGDQGIVAPVFGRQTIFDAVANSIDRLHPPLWQVKTTDLTNGSGWIEAPADMIQPIEARVVEGDDVIRLPIRLITGFSPSATDKAVIIYNDRSSTVYTKYRAEFTAPTAESDDLATLGVAGAIEQIVTIDTVAYIVGSRDIEQSTIEHIMERLGQEGTTEPGPWTNLRQTLIQYREYLIQQEQEELRTLDNNVVEYQGVVVP